jgi:hypothetical protein
MGKVAIHYGWLPMILYVGEHFCKYSLNFQDTRRALLDPHFGSIPFSKWELMSGSLSHLVVRKKRIWPFVGKRNRVVSGEAFVSTNVCCTKERVSPLAKHISHVYQLSNEQGFCFKAVTLV